MGRVLSEHIVRQAHAGDRAGRLSIMAAATQELRRTYYPKETGKGCISTPAGALVALERGRVVGTVEYVLECDHVYLQGIAVHPKYRRRGICRSLLAAANALARENGLNTVVLYVIEETGNVTIFERLGFNITRRVPAVGYVSPTGAPVTRVEMERRIE